MERSLGVCYYPEHWDESLWNDDATKMVKSGISWVRIGEFAWKQIEPIEGNFQFEWLDKIINILGSQGLKVVLGTPTATPPKWVVNKYPDIFALDEKGLVRKFGSRRHYCFSHKGYLNQCRDIVSRLAERYGSNQYVKAWQIDNEYACHDTTFSYSKSALRGFQEWLRECYSGEGNDGDIKQLNKDWGNVFWSMEYDGFEEIELPNLTVTDPNPSHLLAFRKYSSKKVVEFNKLQVNILRQYSHAPLTHNFMGRITEFDHYDVAKDLDFVSWDSYPLGFSEDRIESSDEEKRHFSRQGHPDFQAFHHDLYRCIGNDRFWIMEQQPGPVNWAPYNPAPHKGMVRLWTWEAFAHGAETVCYFRWRQVPFAQEQMHAGLNRPDNKPAPGLEEVKNVSNELKKSNKIDICKSNVGILFDYDSDAMWNIQPQGEGLSYFNLIFDIYCSLRRLGISIDFLSPKRKDFKGYKLIIASGMMFMSDELKNLLVNSNAHVLFGPRSSLKDKNLNISIPLGPNIRDFDLIVDYVETIRPDMKINIHGGGNILKYFEHIESLTDDILISVDNQSIVKNQGNLSYLAGCLDKDGYDRLFKILCLKSNIETIDMPYGVRRRQNRNEDFWFNYNSYEIKTTYGKIPGCDFLKI